MNYWRPLLPLSLLVVSSAGNLHADTKETIGLTDLLARKPGLNGSGINLAQVEAGPSYQPSPAAAVQPAALFNFFDGDNPYSTGAAYNPAKQSGHANTVANFYYDLNTGVATDPNRIHVFDAGYFYNNIVAPFFPTNIGADVINQSFIFNDLTASQINTVNREYDNYAARYGTLFVNGLNNGSGSSIPTPASSYNCIAVGREDLGHSTGLTSDGRSKGDIIAPGSAASYATPLVAGSAAVLMEAAANGDGGAGTAGDAADPRTVKALLLNGAVKDTSWSHTSTAPLDTRRGAGMLNINRSHLQLEGGKHAPTTSVSYSGPGIHVPSSSESGTIASRIGWNFGTITNSSSNDRGDNYYFSLPSGTSSLYDVTITLAWNRQNDESTINNLDLYLFNKTTGAIVASSVSSVDNVEHIYLTDLAAGDYVVQVMKRQSGRVSNSETYALAFNHSIPAPDAPSAIAASAISTSQINLSWTDNSSDETNFELQRSLSSNKNFNTIETLAANTTTHTDTGLTTATKYYYRIKATNSNGDSFYSNLTNATTWTPLEDWRNTHFGTISNTGTAADDADPDNDSLSNLLEYALGTDPNSGMGADGASAQPKASVINIGGTDYLQITVTRAEKKSDITYLIQSGDLTNTWLSDITILEDTATTLRARHNSPLTSGTPRLFLRLKVTQP